PEGLDVNVGGEQEVAVCVSLPEATRATDSAEGAFKNVDLTGEATIRYILQIFDQNDRPSDAEYVKYSDEKSVVFPVRLVPGRDYRFVVWADYVDSNKAGDKHYNTRNNEGKIDLRNITLKDTWVAMDETRDAFTATQLVEDYSSTSSINITLKRPFAKLRVVTTDVEALNNLGIKPHNAVVTYTTQFHESFNAFNGQYGDETVSKTHTGFIIKEYDDNVDNKSKVLFTDYFFADDSDVVKFVMNVNEENGSLIKSNTFNTDIFVQRNYLTTIQGNILTDGNNVKVTVEDAFVNGSEWNPGDDKYDVEVWDGKSISVPSQDSEGNYIIKTPSELAWLAAAVNGTLETRAAAADSFAGKTFVLTQDIDLGDEPWTPIGNSTTSFKGTFDGNGKIITNLVVNGYNSNVGLFGYTTDGEIKNVTIENAKVSGRLNVGVVAGNPYTSKYTNITVKGHVEVNGMAYAGGVGGKNAYADWTNITVNVDETSYVKANSVENGTAYRTYVGGVVGFNGEGGHKFTNITSNIDVKGSTCDVGGLFGIAHYGNQFENCSCSGDVEIYAAEEAAEAEEIGGIAGVWHNENNTSVTMTNVKFTGNVTTNFTRENVWYNNLVGKPYSATGTGKLIVDGYEMVANGVGLKDGEYYVMSAQGLVWVEAQEDKYFAGKTIKLANDIDMTGVTIANPIIFWNGRTTFDGQDYTISNLTMSTDSTEKKPFSLFGGTADIKNVKFDNANISGYSYVAVVAGNLYGNIENCHVSNSSVTCTYWMAGAMSGQYNAGNITNCSVTETTITGPAAVGALVGVINETKGERKVEKCTVTDCTIAQNGSFGGNYDEMFGAAVGLINIENSTVHFNECTVENTTVKGNASTTLYGVCDSSTTVLINGGKVVTTLAQLEAALTNNNTVIIGANIEDATIMLPATLNNFTLRAAEGVVLKNTTISATDGNAYHYENLTFDGITFDKSRILLTGWRNGEEVIKNLTVTNCVFQNIEDTTNTAAVHINKDASEAVENFTFTNNVINGATGGSKSGVYAQVTGKVVFENNVINNVSFRPYVIQITTDDSIADTFTVRGNTFSGSSSGRAQGLGNNAEGTDSIELVVSGNIFKDITESQQICYWNFNAATTTADLSKNYYDIDIESNPSRIYYNAAASSVEDLKAMGVYPFYTKLNADGTIDLNSLKQAE
ncbi:MAG: hypothetical protein J6U69_02205, partial [Alistipes sp.]|nr:hypothetical protein [Alistipes sp.]